MSQPVFTFVLSLKTMKLLINCIQNGDLFKVYINPVVFINLKYMPKKVYLFHRIDFKSCAIIKKAIVSICCYGHLPEAITEVFCEINLNHKTLRIFIAPRCIERTSADQL